MALLNTNEIMRAQARGINHRADVLNVNALSIKRRAMALLKRAAALAASGAAAMQKRPAA